MHWFGRYTERDTDTLEMADMLVAYMTHREPRRRHGNGMRCQVHNEATYRALQLLNVQRRLEGWFLRTNWRKRLVLAGVDPETMEVVDKRRWARAWQWLSSPKRCFKEADALRGIALDLDAPWPCEPIAKGPKNRPLASRRAKPKTLAQVFAEEEGVRPRSVLSRFRTRIEAESDE